MNGARTSIWRRIREVTSLWSLYLLAVACIAVGAPRLVDDLRFVAAAHSTTGVIVEVEMVDETDLYRPIVEYTGPDGRRVRFASGQTAGDRSTYRVGQSIGVLYAPDNPADARLDTWQSRWASDAILPALGVLLILLGFVGVWQSRRPAGPHQAERRFTASPARTYAALAVAVRTSFHLHSCDESTMRIWFGSGMSLFTRGETFTAQVTPAQSGADGALVRVTGVGNVSAVLFQASRLNTQTQRLFTDLAALLDSAPAKPNPIDQTS
jgi:uncharacterized protein DUF3592